MKNLQIIQAESLPAALAEVRRRMGEGAVILHTRSIEQNRWFGLRKRSIVELTVAKSNSCLPGVGAVASFSQAAGARKPSRPIAEGIAPTMPSVKDDVAISSMRDLRAEIDALTARVDCIVHPSANEPNASPADHLSDALVSLPERAIDDAGQRMEWAVSESTRVARC